MGTGLPQAEPGYSGAEPGHSGAGTGRSRGAAWLAGAGSVLPAAALGLVVVVFALLSAEAPEAPGNLSGWGRQVFRPEVEVRFYLAGVGVALALMVTLLALRRRAGARRPVPAAGRVTLAVVAAALATVLLVEGEQALGAGDGVPGAYKILLLAAATLCGAAVLGGGANGPSTNDAGPGWPVSRWAPWELLVPVAVGLLVYVPPWRSLTGPLFVQDTFLLHWDYFAMTPALGLKHGLSLGTDIYPNYGVGWPAFFAGISGAVPLSYGRMIQIGSIYACLYLTGVYLLIRLVSGRVTPALAGIALAAAPFFFWTNGLFLWLAPAVTPMRTPFDIWCFVALALHLRSGRRSWAVLAGVTVGLEVLFEVQAGLVLVAAFGFFWICAGRLPGAGGRRSAASGMFAAAAAMILVVGAGLLATAGTGIFTGRFWSRWLDEPLDFLTVPLSGTPTATLVGFGLVALLYLAVIAATVSRIIGARADHIDALTGSAAFYGLTLLVKFIHYSANTIFPRLLTPAAIVVALLAWRAAGGLNPLPMRWSRLAPVAVLASIAAVGATFWPQVAAYPNLFAAKGTRTQTCLLPEPQDICGAPANLAPATAELQVLFAKLEELNEQGMSLGVIDETGSMFNLATGTAPTPPTSRPFTSAYTTDQIDEMTKSLEANPPDAVLTRQPLVAGTAGFDRWAYFGVGPREDSPYLDTWAALLEVVHRDYRLVETLGPFEIWYRL